MCATLNCVKLVSQFALVSFGSLGETGHLAVSSLQGAASGDFVEKQGRGAGLMRPIPKFHYFSG